MKWGRLPSMRRCLWMCVALAAVWLCCSCGGSNAPPQTLSGDVTTDNFAVAAGETVQVTDDLTLRASESITIDGRLIVSEGASLDLLTPGDLTVNGYIGTDVSETARSSAETRQASTPRLLFFGQNVRIERTDTPGFQAVISAPVGTEVLMATTAGGSITIAAGVFAGRGQDATSPINPGQDGRNIEIGTQRVLDAVQARGETNVTAPAKLVFDFAVTLNDPSLNAGSGGRGATDKTGNLDNELRELVGRGGTGGNGGEVRIVCDTLQLIGKPEANTPVESKPFIRGGIGGTGGSVDFISAPQPDDPDAGPDYATATPMNPAPNGTQPGEGGFDVRATDGQGGNGGNVALTINNIEADHPEILSEQKLAVGGPGGVPGFLVAVTPGNGGDGGPGGGAIVRIPPHGQPGTGPEVYTLAQPSGLDGTLEVVIARGGNGGNSTRAGVPGGDSGFVSVLQTDGAPVAQQGFGVSVAAACNGGQGFSGCGLSPPVAGTNGGGLGTAPGTTSTVVLGTVPLFKVQPAFRAGDGGSGDPPGLGGRVGRDDLDRPVGTPGNDGSTCPADTGGGGGDGGGDGGTDTVPGVTVTVD